MKILFVIIDAKLFEILKSGYCDLPFRSMKENILFIRISNLSAVHAMTYENLVAYIYINYGWIALFQGCFKFNSCHLANMSPFFVRNSLNLFILFY